MGWFLHVVGLKAPFFAEPQHANVLRRQITKKGGVQQQRMIAIVVEILFLQRNAGIVIVVEYGPPRLEDGHTLPMNAGSVEKYRRASWSIEFNQILHRH